MLTWSEIFSQNTTNTLITLFEKHLAIRNAWRAIVGEQSWELALARIF